MPSRQLIEDYADWYRSAIARREGIRKSTIEVLVPTEDLWRIDHQALQAHPGCTKWRFRPSALLIEVGNLKPQQEFHVLIAVSNAVSLKDVGELNCYVRILTAASGCVISPKGISNEVRLVQADKSIRTRLFSVNANSDLFLGEWSIELEKVERTSVIPIEAQNYLGV
jgi:hypothetical protein